MSLRTTPVDVSTVGPFDPSPGYGPAVSSVISAAVPVVVDGGVVVGDVVVVVLFAVLVGDVGESPQPTSCKAPNAAPNRAPSRSRPRRSSVAFKSRCNPPKSS